MLLLLSFKWTKLVRVFYAVDLLALAVLTLAPCYGQEEMVDLMYYFFVAQYLMFSVFQPKTDIACQCATVAVYMYN